MKINLAVLRKDLRDINSTFLTAMNSVGHRFNNRKKHKDREKRTTNLH
jgi:hypothetical protein